MQIKNSIDLQNIDPKIFETALVSLLSRIPSRETKKILRSIRAQKNAERCLIITGQAIDEREEKYLINLFHKTFPNSHHPQFEINSSLEGGIRMFFHDEMVELTLNQIKI